MRLQDVQGYPHIDLDVSVEQRSGLNWGQRPEQNREPNQAYIPVPKSIHMQNPDFFPARGVEFTMMTDDGRELLCVIAQDNGKAIETSDNNSILGVYFRDRLGVPRGQAVTVNDLQQYGRNYVTIYKINDSTFFMDFSI